MPSASAAATFSALSSTKTHVDGFAATPSASNTVSNAAASGLRVPSDKGSAMTNQELTLGDKGSVTTNQELTLVQRFKVLISGVVKSHVFRRWQCAR